MGSGLGQRVHQKVTMKGMESSRTKPWKREGIEYSLPEEDIMIGRVVSIEVTPAAEMGGERAGESRQERGDQEGGHLPYNVGQQSDGAELGATVARYEYAGNGVVAEAGADCETVCGRSGGKDQRSDEGSGESTHDSADREQGHTDIKGAELGDDLIVASDADPDAEKQGAQGIEGQIAFDQ